MKIGDTVKIRNSIVEECDKWGCDYSHVFDTLVDMTILIDKKVIIRGITKTGLYIKFDELEFAIPASAVMTLTCERKEKIKDIFE